MNTKQHQYTDEELELLGYAENQNPDSVPNVEVEKQRYKRAFMDNATKESR